MADYDFSSLNDKEFELLSVDLLSCHLGCSVERFKAGRDGGVDGRFFATDGKEVIIQCKHWIKSGLSSLLRSIENTEAEKVQKLKPKRYIFITSLELSRANKITIKKLLSPFILTESDILGNEDLNDILSRNPEIEKKHYKLWITSTNVLRTILNLAIIGRSRHKLEEIIEESSRYVVTRSHSQAMDKLEKIHSIIITGSPGVGKTSLADQLCQCYVANGYEFYFIENSLNEAEGVYNEEAKQVYYFDDFLGRNFLLALNSHQDSHVINFIKRVERDSKKRFILTSRSNILNQGKRLSDLFEIKKVDRNEYELSINSLTEIDKAKILYNHIWFGQLDENYINEIYKEKRYLRIINHKNFNPRLISFITDAHRLSQIPPEIYWDHIENTLSNPKDIWRNVFDVQVDNICRHITVAVSINGQGITEENLKELYQRLISSNLSGSGEKSYDSVVRLLAGALLNRNVIDQDKVSYNLFNPSIADFVISNYLSDFEYIDEIISCLQTVQSISNLKSLLVSKVIDNKFYCELIESQLSRLSTGKDGGIIDSYKLRILASAAQTLSPGEELMKYISRLAENALLSGSCDFGCDYFEFINWALELRVISPDSSVFLSKLNYWVLDYEKDMNEFIPLSKIVVFTDNPSSSLSAALKEQYIEYLSEEITSDIIEEGILRDVYNIDSYDPSLISDYVNSRLSELAISFENSEIVQVSDCCDIDNVIESNINASMNDDHQYEVYKEQRYSMESTTDAIHDLFDRS